MQKFSQQDILSIPSNDKYLIQLIKPDLINGPWIAGGAVIQWFNGLPVRSHDVDIFFKNSSQYHLYEKFFQQSIVSSYDYPTSTPNDLKDCSLVFDSPKAKTYKYQHWKIQLIKTNFFNSINDLLDHFDITACKLATDGKRWYTNHPSTINHIENKILDMDLLRPEMAVKRLFKYWIYGYQPTVELIERIQQTPNIENDFAYSTDYDS